MFAYNKTRINLLAILISIIIFIILNNFLNKNINKNNKVNTENTVYFEVSNNLEVNSRITSIGNFYKSNNWRIIIPKIKLDAPIEEGTDGEILKRYVGHMKETEILNGNVVLAAHNRGYRSNFFQEIKKLEKGDEILYQVENEKRNYTVIENKIIKETNLSEIGSTSYNRLTLITCEENKKEYRRCVIALENNIKGN